MFALYSMEYMSLYHILQKVMPLLVTKKSQRQTQTAARQVGMKLSIVGVIFFLLATTPKTASAFFDIFIVCIVDLSPSVVILLWCHCAMVMQVILPY